MAVRRESNPRTAIHPRDQPYISRSSTNFLACPSIERLAGFNTTVVLNALQGESASRIKRAVPVALFQTNFAKSAIDTENGIIRGVRVMELGKLAKFSAMGADGKKIHKEATLSEAHLNALMSHAGNRSIPVHLTHRHTDGKEDGLASKAGALKGFFRDETTKDLCANLHLVPGPIRENAIWHAENDPDNFMLSAVYSFLPEDELCIPQSFDAADLVEKGAGVTALLAESSMADDNQPTDLVSQLVAACQDPHALAAFEALVKSVKKGATDSDKTGADVTADDDAGAVAAMSLGVNITDADRKPEDAKQRPLVACMMQRERVRVREQAEMLAKFESAKADLLIAAQAEIAATLGTHKTPAPKTVVDTALFGLAKVEAGIRAQLSKSN